MQIVYNLFNTFAIIAFVSDVTVIRGKHYLKDK